MKELFNKVFKKSFKQFKEQIHNNLKINKKTFIVTANPETFMIASKDDHFSKLLIDEHTTIVPDGIGVVKATRILGYKCEERIPGVEIATYLLEKGNELSKSIYIFGSRQEVIDSLKGKILQKYPNLDIVGVQNGYVEDKDKVFEDVANKKPDIVLVALGIPHQEKIIYKHLDKFSKGIFIGVGGSLDVISGFKKRAPILFRKLNLEWLYRLIKEPSRIKRFYKNNVVFLFRILKLKKKVKKVENIAKSDKNTYMFEHVVYKGNIMLDFYIFCLKNNWKIIKYSFKQLKYLIKYNANKLSRKELIENIFCYLKGIYNIEDVVKEFWKKHEYKIQGWFLLNINTNDVKVISEVPTFIIEPICKKIKIDNIIVTDMNKLTGKIDGDFPLKKKGDNLYIGKTTLLNIFTKFKNVFIIKNGEIKHYQPNSIKERVKLISFYALIIIFLSSIITFVTFCFSNAVIDLKMMFTYFQSPTLLILNFLPVFLLITMIYILTNRLWLGYSLSALLFVGLATVNKFKLMYRDDPLIFSDFTIINEAAKMGERYSYIPNLSMILIYIFLLLIALLLLITIKNIKVRWQGKIISFILITIISVFLYQDVYTNSTLYNNLGDKSRINIWSFTQNYRIKGFIYPFIYSSNYSTLNKPINYDEDIIKEKLNLMNDYDIPNEEKVNIISIMLEAYNDFSKFENIEFNVDIYENFRNIKNESIQGNIISNVFGGGTIDTERKYLTGFSSFPSFRSKTNSYVWYLKEQGYYTEAMHPIYGWFYNRRNVDLNLGFDNFDYYENKYSQVQSKFLNDVDFFQYIIDGYEENKGRDKPYFNFSVTYQNHGPYPSNKQENDYLVRKENMNDEVYNMLNTYFAGIYNTDIALGNLIEYFSSEDEPVVVLIFSDHNPFFGQNHVGYQALGIDFNSIQGFLNKFEVPYIIWANDTSKSLFNNNFIEDGRTISPNYLMSELFSYMGLKGNKFMQINSDLSQNNPVINRQYFYSNNKWINKLSNDNQLVYDDYLKYSYYYATNFIK